MAKKPSAAAAAEYDFSGIDDDILLAGKETWGPREGGGGDGTSFWALKANTSRTIYFHTDPWIETPDGIVWDRETGTWFNYRAIYTQEGLAGGIELPGGLKEFAVKDIVIVDTPEGPRRKEIPLSGPDADPLLQMVVPFIPKMNKNANQPYRPVTDKGAVNVVEIGENGEEWPKILVMTGPRMAKLKKKLLEYRDMLDGNFTCVGKQWVLSVSGQGASEELELRWVKGAPPIEMPEPFDIRELLTEQRQKVLDIIEADSGIDVSAEKDAEGYAEETVPYDGPDEPGASPQADKAEYYASMTDTRLKSLLTKKGVRVPARANRETLLKLALEHEV